MVTVERSIVIRRPIEEVYAFVVQPENVPLWSTLPLEVTKTSEGPTRLGTTARFDNNFLGQTLSATFEVTVFEPSTLFRTRTTTAPFPIENVMTFEQLEAGLGWLTGSTANPERSSGLPTPSWLGSPGPNWTGRSGS